MRTLSDSLGLVTESYSGLPFYALHGPPPPSALVPLGPRSSLPLPRCAPPSKVPWKIHQSSIILPLPLLLPYLYHTYHTIHTITLTYLILFDIIAVPITSPSPSSHCNWAAKQVSPFFSSQRTHPSSSSDSRAVYLDTEYLPTKITPLAQETLVLGEK